MLPKENEGERRLNKNPSHIKLKRMQQAVHQAHYVDSFGGKLETKFKKHLMTMVSERTPSVVDLGCGTGTGFDRFHANQKIIGVDRDMNLLNQCRKNHTEATLICCDMASSPFRAETFSSVFAIAILMHLYWLDRVLFQIQQMLNSAGKWPRRCGWRTAIRYLPLTARSESFFTLITAVYGPSTLAVHT